MASVAIFAISLIAVVVMLLITRSIEEHQRHVGDAALAAKCVG